MRILVPIQVQNRLKSELRSAGDQEIGGLLMGEHVGELEFKVVEVSVQHVDGSHVGFLRAPDRHRAQLEAFFKATGSNFERFNYLGEWHSHPLFMPLPSPTDIQTMQSIVADPEVGVYFLVLIIAKLDWRRRLQMSATVFPKNQRPFRAELVLEVEPSKRRGFVATIRHVFKKT